MPFRERSNNLQFFDFFFIICIFSIKCYSNCKFWEMYDLFFICFISLPLTELPASEHIGGWGQQLKKITYFFLWWNFSATLWLKTLKSLHNIPHFLFAFSEDFFLFLLPFISSCRSFRINISFPGNWCVALACVSSSLAILKREKGENERLVYDGKLYNEINFGGWVWAHNFYELCTIFTLSAEGWGSV